MKRIVLWCMGLMALTCLSLWWGYQWRNFAVMLLGLALGLGAVGVLVRPVRTATTVLVSFVLALALAEFGLGLLQKHGEAAAYIDPETDFAKHYWSQSDIGSIPRPGHHSARKLAPDGSVVYDVRYTIGEDGGRVTPRNPLKSDLRVNVLGCSVTFGEGLNDQETLPAQLQSLLPDVLVKNYGIHGYGMHQALAILQSERDTKGNLNVVVTIPWHAERSACVPSFSLGSPRYRMRADGTVERDGVCGGIAYYPVAKILSLSRVYSLVKSAIQSRQGQDEQIELYLGLIRQIARLSESRQQQLVVGFLRAHENWFTGQYSNDKILQAFRDMQVEAIDLTLSPAAERLDARYMISPWDAHPSLVANVERARLLESPLKRRLAKSGTE